jgi:hypothetical protein
LNYSLVGKIKKHASFLFFNRRFLEGPNFMPWFRQRRAAAEQEQQRLWRHARMNVEIENLMAKMTELEKIDSFNAIERYLLREMEVTFLILHILLMSYVLSSVIS